MAASTDLLRWLQRKKYQFEVTLPMYMMTPTENVVLCSFLFIFLSMIVIAIAVYLPEHVTTIFSRAWFYYAGDDSTSLLSRPGAAGTTLPSHTATAMTLQHPELSTARQQTMSPQKGM